VGRKINLLIISISLMFFRKSKMKKIISKLEPLNLDSFLKVKGLSGRVAPDRLRYADGVPVTCLNFAEAQLLTRILSNGFKVRLPTMKEDYTAFRNLDKEYRKNVLSIPEWKAEYLDGSFLMIDPDVRKVDLPRGYDFNGELRIVSSYSSPKESGNPISWFGVSRDKYDRAALVRTCSYNKDEKTYAAGMVPPLSRECIGIRLFAEE
jgi:hypothetical protein